MDPIKESLRVTISLGLIAFFTALIFGISKLTKENFITQNFITQLLSFIIYGFFVISVLSLFLFIILTAAKLKYYEPNILDETLPVGEKTRRFLYDEGIESAWRGITVGTIYYAVYKIGTLFNFPNQFMKYLILGLLLLCIYLIVDFVAYKVMKD